MTTVLSHTTLRELVQGYRLLASELRGHERRRGTTVYSTNRVIRMNRITTELVVRNLMTLADALMSEHRAYSLDDSGETLRECRRAVKESLGRAEHEEAYRKHVTERYEALHEVFTDKRSRKEALLSQVRAWDRVVQHMPAMEQAGTTPGSNKWYSTFLGLFDRSFRAERTAFSLELDGLVDEYRLHRAGVMGYSPQAIVRQKNAEGVVRTGRIVNLRTAGGTYADVDWGHGDPVRGYAIDELEVHFPPERDRLVQAEISYTLGVRRRHEGQVVFDEFEDIVGIVRRLLEEGATEIHIDNVDWGG